MREPLDQVSRATRGPDGEPAELSALLAHDLEMGLAGALDWYLVELADTENDEVERCKRRLKTDVDRLAGTLNQAHWADHNEQHDEDRSFSDAEWAAIVGRCAEAKLETSDRRRDDGNQETPGPSFATFASGLRKSKSEWATRPAGIRP